MIRIVIFCLIGMLCSVSAHTQTPAFPGAEGFGAIASGGRGGAVLYVTTLDPDPAGTIEGSLNWTLRQPGPRYVLFKVSGVIHGIANIVHGDVTIAGHTSPGGITVRGMVCDAHYEQNSCDNLIVRHLRLRPAWNLPLPAGGERLDDALRLDGVKRATFDHVSLAHATDEALQLSWASDVTIQHSTLGETIGSHADLGGALLNYSHADYPQDRIALIKNLWYRVGGRTPEISCESSNYQNQPGVIDSCQQTPLQLELSNNLYVNPGFLVWYNRDVDQNVAAGPYRIRMNAVGNRFMVRPDYPYGMFLFDLLSVADNQLFVQDNKMSRYPGFSDYQLFYCCNDFADAAPNTEPGLAQRRSSRHAFPPIAYHDGAELLQRVAPAAGPLPHDPLNRRWRQAALSGELSTLDYGIAGADDSFALDFDPAQPPPAPLDSDGDGMPDAFEAANGLDPAVADANGSQLSVPFTGVSGYTNLECYLNQLADQLWLAQLQTLLVDGFE